MARTATMALEATKDMTFEQFWASLMKLEDSITGLKERQEKTDEQMRETRSLINELTVDVKGMSDSLSKFTETMFSVNLCEKFDAFGYTFTRSHSETFKKGREKLAQVDIVLENGEYVMLVEVKFNFRKRDVDEHVERMKKVRAYFDELGDKRILLGAVAGGSIDPSVMKYAEKNGFYVMVQNGDSVTVLEKPKTFKPRKWK